MQHPAFLRKPRQKAQGLLEFALALPFLLLLVFGIIEFGRLLQAWLALENGARFGVRYAITGEYDPRYCNQAAAAVASSFGLTTDQMIAEDQLDGNLDCRVPSNHTPAITDWEEKNYALQDWARLPSIRDTAMAGATGIAWDATSTGDYRAFLSNPSSTFAQTNRGNPSLPGYLDVMICSSRGDQSSYFRLDDVPHYYDNIADQAHRYPMVCQKANSTNHNILAFTDDAGGPGDRVRVTLTYRHPLITPFLSTWWPTLRLSSQREGLVEKFRNSRVTGLTGGMAFAPTTTYTPVPTHTFTNTNTFTPTPTEFLCSDTSGILWERWDNITPVPNANSVQSIFNDPRYPWYADSSGIQGNFYSTQTSPSASNYGVRFRGLVCPPYTAYYKFWVSSDDNSVLNLNPFGSDPSGAIKIAENTSWNNLLVFPSSQSSPDIYLVAGRQYYIELFFKEGSGGDHSAVAWTWSGEGIPEQPAPTVIPQKNLYPVVRETVPPEILCADTGGPLREYWTRLNLLSTPVSSFNDLSTKIAGNPPTIAPQGNSYPGNFVGPSNWDNNYGQRFRAYLCPPRDGNYTFWIASDDDSALFLSSNENPALKTRIAFVSGSVGSQAWGSKTSQKSGQVYLEGGERYFIEAVHREGSGSDHIAVAWTGPFMAATPQVIQERYLIPYTPVATATPATVANCNALQVRVDSRGTPATDVTYLHNTYIDLYLKNTSLDYTIKLLGMAGSYVDEYHRVDANPPSMVLNSYTWDQNGPGTTNNKDAVTMQSTNLGLGTALFNWAHDPFPTPGTMDLNAYGNLRLLWNRNFRVSNQFNAFDNYISNIFSGYQKESNYFHGDDFELTLHYQVGTLDCHLDVTGAPGPVVTVSRLNGTANRFNLQANVTASEDWYRTVREVHFTVYNSSNVAVHHEVDTSAPYCLFGRDATGACPTNMTSFAWNRGTTTTDDDIAVTAGTYTVYVVAADTGFSTSNDGNNLTGSYATRVEYELRLTNSLPTATTTMTPTFTLTATRTLSPTATLTATRTMTPSNTPTATSTFTPSNTPTITPSRNVTSTFTPTPTPTNTRTPRPTACPPEDPNCLPTATP